MAQEVFTAAGDPNVFPDQIQAGLRPWAPLKVYARVPNYSIGERRDVRLRHWQVGAGALLQLRHEGVEHYRSRPPTFNIPRRTATIRFSGAPTFKSLAQGWGFQKTQNGGGYVVLPGEAEFQLPPLWLSRVKSPNLQSDNEEQSFFDGIDTSLTGHRFALAHGDAGCGLPQGRTAPPSTSIRREERLPPTTPPLREKTRFCQLHDGYLATAEAHPGKSNASKLSEDDKANIGCRIAAQAGRSSTPRSPTPSA